MHKSEPTWKVLILDKDTAFSREISSVLEKVGCSVWHATNGKDGMESCGEIDPHIVLMEIDFPDCDGIQLLSSIKTTYPSNEVIVMTSMNTVDNILKCFHLGAVDFIGKPIEYDALLASLERARKHYLAKKKLQQYTDFIEEKWLDTSEKLAKIFQFQKRLVESSIDGIIGCDYDGKVIIFNRSMERMLGYPKNMVVGKMFLYQLFSFNGWEKFQDQLYSEQLGGEDKLFLSESTLISKAGEKIPVRLSAQVLFQKDEEIGVVVFFRDLRTVKRLKQQFLDQAKYLHQDKMVSLGKLAASVVHEINNPLTGVINYINLMSKIVARDSLNEAQIQKFKKYLDIMGSEVKRSSEIVSNLLTFSRKSKMVFGEVDVASLLERSILLSNHKLKLQNIRIETHLYPEASKVWGDFNQLQQCILNLIFNAADAMPEGGSLTLTSALDPETRCVRIKIADTGRGIPKESLSKIFDPFYSTKQEGKGLGLGLSVVYGIIDRHKGTITVESELEKGSVFTIQLPVSEEGA